MRLSGPLGFLLFWVTALGVGTVFVLLVVGAGIGWLILAAVPALAMVLIGVLRARRRP